MIKPTQPYINLNLTEFIKAGKFGAIELGQTKYEIKQNFPPEKLVFRDVNDKAEPTMETSGLWKYGNILSGIVHDDVPNLDGGEHIKINDWWLIKEKEAAPKLIEVIENLNALEIDYIKNSESEDIVTLCLENGVYLSFENYDDSNYIESNNLKLSMLGINDYYQALANTIPKIY